MTLNGLWPRLVAAASICALSPRAALASETSATLPHTLLPVVSSSAPMPWSWDACDGTPLDLSQRVREVPHTGALAEWVAEEHDFSGDTPPMEELLEGLFPQLNEGDEPVERQDALLAAWMPNYSVDLQEAVIAWGTPSGSIRAVSNLLVTSREFQCYPETGSQVRSIDGIPVAQLTTVEPMIVVADDEGCDDIESPSCSKGCEVGTRRDLALFVDPQTGEPVARQWTTDLSSLQGIESAPWPDPVERCLSRVSGPQRDASLVRAAHVDELVVLDLNDRYAALRLLHRGVEEVASESCSTEPVPGGPTK